MCYFFSLLNIWHLNISLAFCEVLITIFGSASSILYTGAQEEIAGHCTTANLKGEHCSPTHLSSRKAAKMSIPQVKLYRFV